MECFVVGLLLSAFVVRSYIKTSKSWDGLSKQLNFKKKKEFRLEGMHQGHRVVIEQVPSKNGGSPTTQICIQVDAGWPSDLIIHSASPSPKFMPTLPMGTLITTSNFPIFSLKFAVLNVPISNDICNRILNLPRSEFFFASKKEIRFVFFQKPNPQPVDIRKLLFQMNTIMKKVRVEQPEPLEVTKNLVSEPNNPFMDINYESLVDTFRPPSNKNEKNAREDTQRIEKDEASLEKDEASLEDTEMLLETEKEAMLSLEASVPHLRALPVLADPSTEEEKELLSIHKSLSGFGISSQNRTALIQKCTISIMEVTIADIRSTFELGMEKEYQKGQTLLGTVGEVPVRVYLPQSQNHLWKTKKRGSIQKLSVHIHGYDVLQKRLVFIAN